MLKALVALFFVSFFSYLGVIFAMVYGGKKRKNGAKGTAGCARRQSKHWIGGVEGHAKGSDNTYRRVN